MTFKQAVLNTTVEARTWNGMKAIESSLDAATDLFYKIGASRGRDITSQFERAYQDDPEVALRIAQWARDVRGGAGERELFRQVLRYVEKNHKDDLLNSKLLSNIPEIGRWDDLLVFNDPEVRHLAFSLIAKALSERNGLCAKWMPRKGADALALREFMNLSPKKYRKLLVTLTNVVETQMCAKDWEAINFSHVPSLAMSRYTKAFAKNAPSAFSVYKHALKSGDPSVKVNAAAVYPYDVIKTIHYGDSQLADEQWKALPNYVGDSMILPVVDVSGSMGTPAGGYNSKSNVSCLDVAVSLGLYCSDKNTGPFKDLFLTFSTKSQFVHLKGTLSEKLYQMERSSWEMSTNLHSAFNEILRVATINRVAPEDMPKAVLIMSDMQFNQCMKYDNSAIEMIHRKYQEAGYEVPGVVFWNLNDAGNVPVRFDEKGTALVSGFSPSILKAVLSGDFSNMTAESIMLAAISSDRYAL